MPLSASSAGPSLMVGGTVERVPRAVHAPSRSSTARATRRSGRISDRHRETPQSDRPPPPECPAHRRGAALGSSRYSNMVSTSFIRHGSRMYQEARRRGAQAVRPKAERADRGPEEPQAGVHSRRVLDTVAQPPQRDKRRRRRAGETAAAMPRGGPGGLNPMLTGPVRCRRYIFELVSSSRPMGPQACIFGRR